MKTISLIIMLALTSVGINAQNANLSWAKQIGGTDREYSEAIAVDANRNVYTTGYFFGTTDFDPGAGVFNMTATGSGDIYVLKLDSSGNFAWAISMGSATLDIGSAIAVHGGHVYVAGYFTGTVDFDPGAGTLNFISAGLDDIFVMKLNTAGNLVWAKQMGGGSADKCNVMEIDQYGNIYTTGDFWFTSDFDPSTGVSNLNSFGQSDVFISKLDSAGDFIWAKQLGGTGNDVGWGIAVDDSGNVLTTGYYQATADFDPDITNFNISAVAGSADIFISKLDTAGNFVWAKSIGDSNVESGNAITSDQAGNVYLTGHFNSTPDFDPGAGVFNLTAFNSDVFILKLTANGNFVWAKSMGGLNYDHGFSIQLDAIGNIYTAGDFGSSIDFDPGPGVDTLVNAGNYDGFISKLDPAGNYVWAVAMGGFLADNLRAIALDAAANIYSTGRFKGTSDFNPGAGTFNLISAGMEDAFVVKLIQNNCPDLAVVFDTVAHIKCVPATGYIAVHTINGTAPYSYTWNVFPADNDSIYVPTSNGIYQVDITDAAGCTTFSNVLIDGPEPLTGFDLAVKLITNRGFRPGFTVTITLDAYNLGCSTVAASLYLVLGNQVDYNTANPLPTSVSGDTLMWSIAGISNDSAHFKPVITLTTDVVNAIGDTLCLLTYITPYTGDVDTTNNEKNYCRAVVGAYDPNDKHAYPLGECVQGYVDLNQKMEYTINFQNTGNASAINVFLVDTLDAAFDISTLRVASNSHPVITEVFPGNVAKFRFDNINLIDSNVNEPASHGYVVYDIEPVNSIASGTIVENSAGIYFDFNAPVITNTVMNIFVDTIPNCVIGIETLAKNETGFRIYPNPVSSTLTIKNLDVINEIKIFDVLGKEVYSSSNNKSIVHVNASNFENGIYFIQVSSSSGLRSQKLIVQQ